MTAETEQPGNLQKEIRQLREMIEVLRAELENQQLEPDVLVENDAESVARGEDRQLEAAVRTLLEDLDR